MTYIFSWKVTCNAPKSKLAPKISETLFTTMNPTLNDQIESEIFLEMELRNIYKTIKYFQ